jgi:Domain of unknown function (DUF4190)
MTVTGDPFRQTPGDPPSPFNGQPGVPYVQPATPWPYPYEGQNPYPPGERSHNTLAVLSPVFAVVLPPAGAILGHWALAQIRRTGEAGRTAAIWGLILGYALTVTADSRIDRLGRLEPFPHSRIGADAGRHSHGVTAAAGPAAPRGDVDGASAE